MLEPWIARLIIGAAVAALCAIRIPHVKRSLEVKVVKSLESPLDRVLVVCVILTLVLALAWVASLFPSFASYPLRPVPLALGSVCLAAGLWLLHRSHADLGVSWSNTLELREGHRLVTEGVYRRVRHPMYTALLLYSLGQALVLPNWLAGPSSLLAFALLVALRLGREERMLAEAFGREYEAYAARTQRLIPGIW